MSIMTASRLRLAASTVARDAVLNTAISSRLLPRPLRTGALRIFLREVDATAVISADCFYGGWNGLSVGARSFVNYGCFFDLGADISIGADVSIGYQTLFITSTHDIGSPARRAGKDVAKSISVGDGAWIGARVTVLPGVSIGAGAVVAAGSTVVTDIEGNNLYAGSPATKKRSLPLNE